MGSPPTVTGVLAVVGSGWQWLAVVGSGWQWLAVHLGMPFQNQIKK